ncbi:MAG: hypothetical protein IJ506_03165 [Clostridia bacterium]|nr:hypothetical protein [Clostridia bacterium]
MNKKTTRIISSALGLVLASSIVLPVAGCGDDGGSKKNRDSIVIMSEELSGLFNPFYATSGPDMEVVGMTQLGMLATDEKGKAIAGKDEATAVLDFQSDVKEENDKTTTEYTFVLKNGLKFSDGKPLTMNDVMFNIYEYLDPVYTGSSTMYSIDIVGLTQYRTQTDIAGETGETESLINEDASAMAETRIQELIDVYEVNGDTGTGSYSRTEAQMEEDITNHYVSDGYKDAVADEKTQETMKDEDYNAILLADYKLALKTFKEELEADYLAAKDAYDLNSAPYKDWKEQFSNEVFCFLYYEGKITPNYEGKGTPDENKAKIESFNYQIDPATFNTKEKAINRVYSDTTTEELNAVLTRWGTSTTLLTTYQAEAKDIILHNYMKDGMTAPNIEGIVSLGHTSEVASVTVNGVPYTVAHEHREDGTPANAGEYDVLQITINGIDPKAIYSFGFTVAPAHYYGSKNGKGDDVVIDIKNNKFGVEYASSDFQTDVIKAQKHVEVPVGAGAYVATDADNNDNPNGTDFWSSNIVYFKANEHFMFPVKTEKLRMQVVSASNAIDKLVSGEVDFVTPQFTKQNSDRLDSLKKKGFESLNAWQLGYGYIGINAGKVPNLYIRRAIMAAMNTSLSLEYYAKTTAKNIKWPMSMESWAYPFETGSKTEKTPTTEANRLLEEPDDLTYLQWTGVDAAKNKINRLVAEAENWPGEINLNLKFTIAGASITEHPTYEVFKQAAEILNACGWEVEVKADPSALTKLSTGSLAVWAAAWGSSVDPDMYQVYHKDSTATSVYAWGYREIKNAKTTTYAQEWSIIEKLSKKIDEGRETLDETARKNIYTDALVYVLQLAVEMPVYQRKTLYAYNANTIKGVKPQSEVDAYNSPLAEIWNLELVK